MIKEEKGTQPDSKKLENDFSHPNSLTTTTLKKHRVHKNLFHLTIWGTHVLLHFIAVLLSYNVAHWIYIYGLDKSSPQTSSEFILVTLVISTLYSLCLERSGTYKKDGSVLHLLQMSHLLKISLVAGFLTLATSFYIRDMTFSRITITLGFILTPFALLFAEDLFTYILRGLQRRGIGQKRTLIYGAGQSGIALAKKFFFAPQLGYQLIGFLDDNPQKYKDSVNWPGKPHSQNLPIFSGENLLQEVTKKKIDLVIIALPHTDFYTNRKLVEKCLNANVEYAIIPNSYEKFSQHLKLSSIIGVPMLTRQDFQPSYFYILTKRIFDIIFSILGLFALSPVFLFLSFLIRREPKSSAIFTQKRVGQNGKVFNIYKLRTMSLTSDPYATSPNTSEDSRITQLGRFLRRSSLDELPQLWNVLRGDMSFVGPRPEMPFIVSQYTEIQKLRLLAKPGITGVWQVSADRGLPIHENIEYDLFYINHRSLFFDIAILLKTFTSTLKGIGAI